MKKSTKQFLFFSSAALAGMYAYNRFVAASSTKKNMLPTKNGSYYSWKQGNIFYTKLGKGSPVLLKYSPGYDYSNVTPNWQNFFSEDDRWATPQDIEPGKIYYCDENEALVPLATNNDIQSLVGNINTLLESIDTGAGV